MENKSLFTRTEAGRDFLASFFASFLIVFAGISSVYALPLIKPFDNLEFLNIPSQDQARAKEVSFEGIVGLSNCSGSLVRFQNSLETDPALVLTNGHCLTEIDEFLKPGEVLYNEISGRSFTFYSADRTRLGGYRAKALVYATMTNTDAALYELRVSFRTIFNEIKVRPFTLTDIKPDLKQTIDILSGYHLTAYSCFIDKFIHKLKEASWVFTDSIRYSQPGCEIIHGTSGSPILDLEKRVVIGINNTGSDDGLKCTMDNPCEVDENGKVFYQKGLSYGQQIYGFSTCVDSDRKLDFGKKGCLLPKPTPKAARVKRSHSV